MSVNVWEVDGETSLVTSNVVDKAEAVLIEPTLGALMYIHSSDGIGNLWRAVVGAAPGTYSDDGGSYCGTIFIPTGGDGSSAWIRDYQGRIISSWYGSSTDIANNSPAILAAIAHAEDIGGGDVVIPNTGAAYTYSSNITVPSGVRLLGEGVPSVQYFTGGQISATVLRPDSSVTIGLICKSSDRGLGLENLIIDVQDTNDGTVAIEIDGLWNSHFRNLLIFGLAGNNSVGIKRASTAQGSGWNVFDNVWVEGSTGVGTGTGWLCDGGTPFATPAPSRDTFISCRGHKCNEGWKFTGCGGGMLLLNCTGEENTTFGLSVDNNTTASYPQIISGEYSGNGTYGIIGPCIVDNVSAAGNGTGELDGAQIERKLIGVASGSTRLYYKGVSVEFQKPILLNRNALVMAVGDSISPDVAVKRITSDGGAVTLTSDPQIVNPITDSVQFITLLGGSNIDTITLVDGQGLRLQGNMALSIEKAITLVYDSSFGDWVETART